MNIFITFKVRDLSPYVEDKEEGHEDFEGKSPSRRGG